MLAVEREACNPTLILRHRLAYGHCGNGFILVKSSTSAKVVCKVKVGPQVTQCFARSARITPTSRPLDASVRP